MALVRRNRASCLLTLFLAEVGMLSAQTFQASQNFPVGSAPVGVTTGDFNRDGKLDITVCNSGSSSISILLGIGNGSFRPRRDIVLGGRPQALAPADFNGDGKLDLAVLNNQGNSVLILLGNGDGTFLSPVFTSVPGPAALAVADFNGDGKPDLAVASETSNTVQILLGIGNGLFRTAGSVSVGIGPVSLALGDFNSDGRTDIAVAHSGSLFVSILLGDGHGFFQRSRDVYTGGSVVSIAAGDFNKDGLFDLAVLASTGSASPVIILMGRGDAMFDEVQRFPVGGSPVPYPVSLGSVPGSLIAIADLNNDGMPDLAVALGGSNSVSVLTGIGDGSFRPFVTFPAGAGPSGVAAGDLSGNGKLDLALSNQGSNSVSVLMNVTALPRRPTFTQSSIVNGASFLAGPLVPGEIVAILGSALGPNELTVSASFATTLAGTRVIIGGVAAPLLYVSASQIGAVVPLDISGLNAGVQIDSSGGVSDMVALPAADAAPGLFSADSSGAGQGVVLNQDGSLNGAGNPAGAGSVVTLFGTGGGQLRDAHVTIGGIVADVLAVIAASGQSPGVFQVQARVPYPSAQGIPSQPGITLWVQ